MNPNIKKYKLVLLKDLPMHNAGTEVLNISQEDLDGVKCYTYLNCIEPDIYSLRHNKEWVRVEEDPRCDCKTRETILLRREIIAYGRSTSSYISFKDKCIAFYYDKHCDQGELVKLPIEYCPLCGEKL